MGLGKLSAIVEKGGLLDEKYIRRRLSNGLECGVIPRPEFRKKFAVIAVNFGSNDDTFISEKTGDKIKLPAGVAHFLEHKMFEDKTGSVFDKFSILGANANAFTSHTVTAYHFSCTNNFVESLKLLIETVSDIYLTKESVRKEVGIIQQEILMYEDNPDWRLAVGLLEALYHRHPVRIDTAGTVESVGKISKKILSECYKSFYTPGNMILVTAGDLEPVEIFEKCESWVGPGRDSRKPEIVGVREPAEIRERKVTSRMEIERPKVAIGFKNGRPAKQGERLVRETLEHDLLIAIMFGKSNPLYLRMYEKGIINESLSASYTANRGFGYTSIGCDTDSPDEFMETCLRAIEKVKHKGISKSSFARTRKRMLGSFLRRFNHIESAAMRVVSGRFLRHNPFNVLEVLDSITRDDINRRAVEHFRDSSRSISLLLPEKKK